MENAHGRWFGSLELRFEKMGAQTVLSRSRHMGPLRVQRPFVEPDGGCQVYVLNPPGGTVGGDELRIYGRLLPGSQALLTAPGAAKFYRSAGPTAKTRQHFEVSAGARLEWLPQETIVYDGAIADVATRVELEASASFVGWEITCLGRPACGESFQTGHWSQRFELYERGRPLWVEKCRLSGNDPALDASWGLGTFSTFGSMALHPVPPEALLTLRQAAAALTTSDLHLAATLLPHEGAGHTLVARVLSRSATKARGLFAQLWEVLRPLHFGSEATAPRIWAT